MYLGVLLDTYNTLTTEKALWSASKEHFKGIKNCQTD